MVDDDRNDLVKLMVSVAEMKGMLSQALTDHGQRLSDAESEISILHGRLTDKGRTIITHSEQITGLQKAVNVLEQAKLGLVAKTGVIIGSCTGIGALLVALYNSTRLGA